MKELHKVMAKGSINISMRLVAATLFFLPIMMMAQRRRL